MTSTLISVFVSALVAGLFSLGLRGMSFTFGRSAAARMEAYTANEKRGLVDRLGDWIVERLGLSLDSWKHELRWAQLGGLYPGKTPGSVLGMALLYSSAGLAYILLFQAFSPMFAATVLLLAYIPYYQLRSKAGGVRQAVQRSLPEAAALIAAEMSAGNSADASLTRAATIPGPLGRMIGEAVGLATQSGRLLFSRGSTRGLLVEHIVGYREPGLEAFAAQIDLVAAKGSEGPRQMGEVARGLAREYRSDVTRASERLDNRLLLPVTLFFFVPLLAAVFIPLMVSIFQTF